MTEFEIAQLLLTGIGTIVIIGTLIGLIVQLRIQGRSVARQAAGQCYMVYQKLCEDYSALLWQAADDPRLNDIWESLPQDRAVALQSAQQDNEWGAWYAMDASEKKAYRYTRIAIELFEQAFEIWQLGWIGPEIWEKWSNWIAIWQRTRFFRFVYEDSKSRLTVKFVKYVDENLRQP